MAKGKNRIWVLGQPGGIQSTKASDWSFIYTTSTTKDSINNIGDVVIVPGRGIFVYSKSSAACLSGQGCEFTYTGYVSYTAFTTVAAVDATSITIPAATHATLTTDELRNGFVTIYDGSTNNTQFRQIIGNDSAASNAAFVVYLDGPLTEAITTSSAAEVYQNPYAALRTGTSTTLAKAGIPSVKVTAASTYFWCQVGRIPSFTWIAPQSGVGAQGGMGCFWRHDGSLESADTALAVTTATYDLSQYAGHTITGTAAGVGPLFSLA